MPDGHQPALALRSGVFLEQFGPAVVTAVLRDELELAHDGGTCMARMALPGVYRPSVGDTVLLLAAGGDAFVIGVLRAAAPATLHVHGDLRICAPHGTISLVAQSVELDAVNLALQADTLSIAATTLRERYDQVRRVVHGLLDLDLGELRAGLRGMFAVSAERIRLRGDADTQIDGKQIRLG